MIPNDVHMVNADGVVELDPVLTAHDAGDSDLITYAKAIFLWMKNVFSAPKTWQQSMRWQSLSKCRSLLEMDVLAIHFTRTFRERKSKMAIQQSFVGVD